MSGTNFAGPGILGSFFEPCHRLTPVSRGRGLMGDSTAWEPGEALMAMIRKDLSPEAMEAERHGEKPKYTVVVEKGVALRHGDALQRDSDGAVFRMTAGTDAWEAPEVSTVQIAKATATRWEAPA